MHICLVDDDSTQLNYFKIIIEKWANIQNINVEIDFYLSAEEMLFENPESYPFDMIILDIQMAKISGIELAKRIRETDKSVILAFVSGIADYVFEGYEVQAIRYILKPIKQEQVFELLDLVKTKEVEREKFMVLSISGEKKKLKYSDIIYVESMGHYVVFHLEKEEIDYKYNISNLFDELSENNFVKTHRSYIVNLKYVDKITKDKCCLTDSIEIPLSRSAYKLVNNKFINYYKGQDN
ncbi:MAG: response regulator transcription factor [Tenericutes bacterium]|nr:response regulator transcription factor [Mycoplasmatota bacterium]